MGLTSKRSFKTISKFIFYILMIFIGMFVLVPLLSIILNSFKNLTESSIISLKLPSKWLWENYITVIKDGHILRAMTNSIIITLISVSSVALLSSLTAFVFSRRKTKLTKFLFYFILLGMMAPIAIIPEIKIMQTIGLYGSLAAMILIHITINLPFSVYLYSGFIHGIPKELDEAAIIDGCNPINLYFKVIFPLLRPVVFTNIVVVFMAVWNDFQYSLYFLTKPSMYTMPQTVYAFKGYYTQSLNLLCGDMVLTVIPVLIVYLLAQKYIISGMTVGSVKG